MRANRSAPKPNLQLGFSDPGKDPSAHFTGYSTVEFLIKRPLIINKFKEKGVYEFVEIPAGYQWPDHIDEEEITAQKPDDDYVNDRVQLQAQAIQNSFMAREAEIDEPANAYTVAERRRLHSENEDRRETRMFSMTKFQMDVEDAYRKETHIYEKAKKDFEDKVGQVISVFTECLGNAVYNLVKEEIDGGLYRRAWAHLCAYYEDANAQGDTINILQEQLNTLVFDGRDFQNFLIGFNTIIGQLESVGHMIPERLRLTYLFGAFERSSYKDVSDVVRNCKLNHWTYADTIYAIQMEISASRLRKQQERIRDQKPKHSINATTTTKSTKSTKKYAGDKKAGGFGKGKREKQLCSKCGKLGYHTASECWKGTVVCGKCGGEHPTEKCNKRGPPPKYPNADTVSTSSAATTAAVATGNGRQTQVKDLTQMIEQKYPK